MAAPFDGAQGDRGAKGTKRMRTGWGGFKTRPLISLLLVRLQRVEGLLDELAAQIFFILQRQLGVASDMDNSSA